MKQFSLTKISLLIIILVVVASLTANAQILPPPPPGPNAAPLDPFSWILLGAGGLAAGKRYFDAKRKKGQ